MILQINKKIVLIFVALAFFALFGFLSTRYAQAGKSVYPELAAQLAKETEAILVKRGACASLLDCNRQERVTWAGSPDSFSISIFQASSLGNETVGEIVVLILKSYESNRQVTEARLKLYKETIQQRNKLFSGIKPFLYLELKGGR